MKRIFLIFAMMLTLTAISQNQTFRGVKTFTSPPKFKNLFQNDLNTKVLTVSSTDVLQWKDAGSFGSSYKTYAAKLIPNANPITDPVPVLVPMIGNTITGVIAVLHDGSAFKIYIDNYDKNKTGVILNMQNQYFTLDIEYKNDHILIRNNYNNANIGGCIFNGEYLEIRQYN